MTPEKFPILAAAAPRIYKTPRYFEEALAEIAAGVEAGSIRNVVLQDAKHTLSRIVDEAWEVHVQAPFFHAGRYSSQPSDVQTLYSSIMIMGLHDVIAASKKITKSKATGPAIDAMRAYIAEVLPLSLAVASLKDKVVKGRAPSTGPSKPENPNKIVKTCPCCFRQIAVVREKMAHHGYERPGQGWQTASCYGIRFKPLEVSSEGLVWIIGLYNERLADTKAALKNSAALTSMMVQKNGRGRLEMETITRESSNWDRHFQGHVDRLKYEISSLKASLKIMDERLANWKPEEA